MRTIVLLSLFTLLTGCVGLSGESYLKNKQYQEGLTAYQKTVQTEPENAAAAYYYGRFLLALDKPEQGLPYLEKAAALEPTEVDYIFWTGVGYWAINDVNKELNAYRKVLALDEDHISANLYLGHVYADMGDWTSALWLYDKVIDLDAYNPEALYNRGIALKALNKTTEAVDAWKQFLDYYPDGKLAMQAANLINAQGDFSYRNFILGDRNVTLFSIRFNDLTEEIDAKSKASLHVIKAMLAANDNLAMHIVTYVGGNKERAKSHAQSVQKYLLNGNPDVKKARLPLSWFDVVETVTIDDKQFTLPDSVRFITIAN